MGKFRLVSYSFFVFFVFVSVRRLCRFFVRFAQGSAETVHFPGDFLAWKLGEIFVFCAVVVTIFCILSVYLFIIIIIIIFFLVGVN